MDARGRATLKFAWRPDEAYRAAIDETIVETNGLLRTFNALLRISENDA
jgi:hypothetical protein